MSMELTESKRETLSLGQLETFSFFLGGGLLLFYAAMRRSWSGFSSALLGGGLIYQGVRKYREQEMPLGARKTTKGIKVSEVVTISKPKEELFHFWRNLENLPRFMRHLESVKNIDGKRSHWAARGPAGLRVEWDAEIVREIENELITWQSFEGADVQNAGSISFRDAPGGRGTEVKVILRYDAPGGRAGAALAKLFGEEPSQQVREDLRRFKQLMEAGEISTVEGQPVGNR